MYPQLSGEGERRGEGEEGREEGGREGGREGGGREGGREGGGGRREGGEGACKNKFVLHHTHNVLQLLMKVLHVSKALHYVNVA